MPRTVLDDRALIAVSGADARAFLQSLVTTDLSQLLRGEIRAGALLSPQGKVMYDFLVSFTDDDTIALDCRADIADEFMRRLTLYKLRAKVVIERRPVEGIEIGWDEAVPAGHALRDLRFDAERSVWRRYDGVTTASAAAAEWVAFRIDQGVPESGADYALGEVFPHDVNLDQFGGIGLRKGCYIGQEVVSRMHHRGTARRRVLIAGADVTLPEPGTEIRAEGKPIGALGSVAGRRGLALVRIDKAKSAMDARLPIVAGSTELTLEIPPRVAFDFPADTIAESV